MHWNADAKKRSAADTGKPVSATDDLFMASVTV